MKTRKKLSVLAVLLISVAVSVVFGQIFWSQTIPTGITVISTYNVGVFANAGRTTVLTAFNWTNIDRLSTTIVSSNIAFLLNQGSGIIIGKNLGVSVSGLPTGFSFPQFEFSQDNGVTWGNQTTPMNGFTLSTNTPQIRVDIQGNGSQAEGTFTTATVTIAIQ